jgi:hypothetical protein
MHAILYTIVMWVLLQLLVVWFCTRLVGVRELSLKDYLELQEHLVRRGVDMSDEAQLLVTPVASTTTHMTSPGVARA